MFRKIGDALSRFMSGRYGTDSLNKALLIVTAVLIVLGWAGGKWLTPWMSVFSLLAYIPLIWSIVRMYSRNVEARRRENARNAANASSKRPDHKESLSWKTAIAASGSFR